MTAVGHLPDPHWRIYPGMNRISRVPGDRIHYDAPEASRDRYPNGEKRER